MKQGHNDCTHTLMQQAGLVSCVLWVQHITIAPSRLPPLLLPLCQLCCFAGDPASVIKQDVHHWASPNITK